MSRNRGMGRAVLAALTLALLVAAGCGNSNSLAEIAEAHGQSRANGSDTFVAAPSAGAAAASAPIPDTQATIPNAGAAGTPTAPAAGRAGTSPARPSGAAASSPLASGGKGSTVAAAPGTAKQGSAGNAPVAPAPGQPSGGTNGACTGQKSPIVIGTVAVLSGLVAPAIAPGVKAVQAWVASANAQGGLDCHPVKYVVSDDQNDPARHQQLLKQLIEREGVIALVFLGSPWSSSAGVDYINQKRVPVIGSSEGDVVMYSSPMYFAHMASNLMSQQAAVLSAATLLQPEGVKRVAILTCQEMAFCNQADGNYKASAEKLGFQVVTQQKASLTQPDYTSQCLAAQRGGAQAFIVALDGASNTRLAASCRRVNFPVPLIMTPSMAADSHGEFAKDPNVDGSVIGMSIMPPFLSGHPAVAEFLAARKQFAPDIPLTPPAMHGWSAAKLFDHAVRGRLPDNPVAADILKGLWSIKGDNLGGLTYPLTFVEGQNSPQVVCAFATRIKNQKIESDGKMLCL